MFLLVNVFFSSGILDTICVLVTGVQTCALPIYSPATECNAFISIETLVWVLDCRVLAPIPPARGDQHNHEKRRIKDDAGDGKRLDCGQRIADQQRTAE